MINIILWGAAFVLHFTYTFPPLVQSETNAALLARVFLSIAIGGVLGAGVGRAVGEVLG